MAATRPGSDFETRIGYRFEDSALLTRSLTHPSYLQQFPHAPGHNQRLEFLGDAVLGLILAEYLCEIYPKEREGVLTWRRAALARGEKLAEIARSLGLPDEVLLSEAEISNGGRERNSILEDALEALIGAIYLDGGYPATRDSVRKWFGSLEQHLDRFATDHNPKGRLQEHFQPLLGNDAISYEVVGESGPDHQKLFEVCVRIDGTVHGSGSGLSKKEAEEAAAREALAGLESKPEARM